MITKMGWVAEGIIAKASQFASISAVGWLVAKACIRDGTMGVLENSGVGRGKFSSGRRKRAG